MHGWPAYDKATLCTNMFTIILAFCGLAKMLVCLLQEDIFYGPFSVWWNDFFFLFSVFISSGTIPCSCEKLTICITLGKT